MSYHWRRVFFSLEAKENILETRFITMRLECILETRRKICVSKKSVFFILSYIVLHSLSNCAMILSTEIVLKLSYIGLAIGSIITSRSSTSSHAN